MVKYFLYILFGLLTFNLSFAQNIDIQEDIKIGLVCKLEKKILKNSKYNYKTFLAKDLNESDLDKFEIESKKPEKLFISGLSIFLSNNINFDVKVVNKDIVLFKAFDKDKNYSESGIINRKSGELVHEVTKDLKSENFEKDISFYKCS
ncbi:hypothetical protein OAN68_01630 [Candidatus Pelagibacter sp.]|nr:hypothetical protein [Candidatus Pelagibacter sp.]